MVENEETTVRALVLHFKNTLKTTIEEMQITFKANTDTIQGET
jgi:hypothetical protein